MKNNLNIWKFFTKGKDIKLGDDIDAKTGVHSSKKHKAKDNRLPGVGYSRFDKKKLPRRKLVEIFSEFLTKIGYEQSPRELNKNILQFDILLAAVLTLGLLVISWINQVKSTTIFTFALMIWTVIFIAIYLLSLLLVFVFLDMRMYQRTKQIEEALPDFLQLTSANISAGMTMDRALWFAVRPKFGILAKEIEDVAKATLTGEELEKALLKFSKKYPSRILKESVNLLIAGLNSGGEMAGILNKIAGNIKDTSLMKKEIAASVTTYVIFIGAATIVAAPILFALSTELLTVIKQITSSIVMDRSSGLQSLFSFNFSGDSISVANFRQFAILVLLISSFFSSAIISTIRKGSVREGLKLIPIFIAVSLTIYLLAFAFFSALLGSIILT